MEMERWASRMYRVRNGGDFFGSITKLTGEKDWTATIRHTDTGVTVRYAGIWTRLRDAREEVEGILERDYSNAQSISPTSDFGFSDNWFSLSYR